MRLLRGRRLVRVLDREDRLAERCAGAPGDVLAAVHVDPPESATGRGPTGRTATEVGLVDRTLRVVRRADHDLAFAPAVEVAARDQRSGRVRARRRAAEPGAGGLSTDRRERLPESRRG